MLAVWGLLDRVLDTGCPKILRSARTIMGEPGVEEFEATEVSPGFQLCPRRTVLDAILVDAAVGAGAEVRQGFSVSELTHDSDGRVTGIVGRDASGETVTEEARIVIGADGPHSRIARLVETESYEEVESLVCGYYSYFSGFPLEQTEFHLVPGAVVIMFPTNDAQVCVAVERPVSDFPEARQQVEEAFFSAIQAATPQFTDALRAAKREEPFQGAADLPQYFRRPFGAGWALVGDAGAHVDPTLGLGISKAFTEAMLLAPAVDAALSGDVSFPEALGVYQQQRDAMWLPWAAQNVGVSRAIGSGRVPMTSVV
ncbi:MAG: NAD(P)/FAD-dependent oxidoreductase [Dehalococcoidia bacterium]|nr:NAD(P)/FAD-dependent oxidoreductase [Dehalococcoidia bacterium]